MGKGILTGVKMKNKLYEMNRAAAHKPVLTLKRHLAAFTFVRTSKYIWAHGRLL